MFIDVAMNDYTIAGIRSTNDAAEVFGALHAGYGFLTLDRNRIHTVRLKSGIEFGVARGCGDRGKVAAPPAGALRLWLDAHDHYHAIDGGEKTDVGRLLYHIMPERQLLQYADRVHYGQVFYLYDYDLYLVGIETIDGKEASV